MYIIYVCIGVYMYIYIYIYNIYIYIHMYMLIMPVLVYVYVGCIFECIYLRIEFTNELVFCSDHTIMYI